MSWIPRAFRLLPGPLGVQMIQATFVLLAVLIALHFIYSWMGILMLDQGGTVG